MCVTQTSKPALRFEAQAAQRAELEQAVTTVEEGTSAGTSWRQSVVNFVLDTGSVTWLQFGAAIGAASETSSGIAEIATQAETDAGTDDARFITPLKLNAWANKTRRAFKAFLVWDAKAGKVGFEFEARESKFPPRKTAGTAGASTGTAAKKVARKTTTKK